MAFNDKNTYDQQALRKFRNIFIIGSMVTILLILFFSYLTHWVFSQEDYLAFDQNVIDWAQSFVSDQMNVTMMFITEIGFIYVIIPVGLIALYYFMYVKKHFWEGVMLLVSILGGDVIKAILKNILQRERPTFLRIVEETGYSFPSGHTMSVITFYGMLAYLLWINFPNNKGLRWTIAIVTPVIVLLVGFSRIYLGVHFPTDVVGGLAVGGAWLITCIMALNAIRLYKSKHVGKGS